MMKKRICGLLTAFFMASALSGCQSYEDVSLVLGADVENAEVILESDSHGGFHGDGERDIIFQFRDDTFEELIQMDQTWHPLPIQDDTVMALLYGLEKDGVIYGPHLWAGQEEMRLPHIEKGYYLFYDRHAESVAPFDSKGVLERNSLNITVAVYNTETDRLYYAELDT